jgi:transposase
MWNVAMRGDDVRMESLFSYLSCEARVPQDHPLRPIRTIVDQSLTVLSPAFDALYSDIGRPSIPPEKLLRALLLQAFYSVRSERQLMEQLDYNLLFRWFVDLAMDAPIWDVTVFTKNRDRFLAGDVAAKFLAAAGLSPRTVVACVDATAVRHLEGEDSMRVLTAFLICTFLTACGAVALPFRVTADVARVVPVAGDVVAAPLDATGDAID